MLFDADMTFITSGFKQISTAAQYQQELVAMDALIIDQNGYLMAYVSNESDQLNYVHFDDLTIVHSKTPIVRTDDYYPFGLTFNSFTRSFSMPQPHKFNAGIERNETTGYDETFYRQYAPLIAQVFLYGKSIGRTCARILVQILK